MSLYPTCEAVKVLFKTTCQPVAGLVNKPGKDQEVFHYLLQQAIQEKDRGSNYALVQSCL